MKFDWKRVGLSFCCAIVLLLLTKFYFCKHSLDYSGCLLEGMLSYLLPGRFIILMGLAFMIYIIWPVFGMWNTSQKTTKDLRMLPYERGAFHYSIASLVLLMTINLSVFISYRYMSRVMARGGIGGTEGLNLAIWILVMVVSFIAVYMISIVKTFEIRNTEYGKKSIRITMITTLILLIDIFIFLALGGLQ